MLALTSSIDTRYHSWSAGGKLAIVAAFVFLLYFVDSVVLLGSSICLVTVAYLVPGPGFLREGIRLIRPLWPFVAVVLVWHVIVGDPETGIAVALRLVAAVALANLVTLTTRLDDLMDVLLWLLTPLTWMGIRTKPIAFAMTLVVRFTPVLLEKSGTMIQSWRARSARRPGWQILMPIALTTLDDAEHVAEALRARGGFDTDA